MSTTTTNYGLIKPGTDDPILVGQLNDNMDTIDTVLKDHSDKIDAAALGIKYKGEVNYYADLPNSAEIGDAYTVKYAGSSGTTPDGTEYVWGAASGVNQWINFSKDSYSKAEVDALLALKQNALSSTQLAAVNSGIDSPKVAQIETNKNNISTCKEFTDNATIDSDRKLYINATEPTGYIPVGSTWINGSTIKEYTGGSNLFNQSDVRLIPANAAGALRCGTNVGVLPPGTYTFNAVKSAIAVLLYLQKVVGDAYTVEDITSLPFSFTTTGVETVIVRTASATVKTWAEQGYTDIMLNFGTTAEMYEPYNRAWT